MGTVFQSPAYELPVCPVRGIYPVLLTFPHPERSGVAHRASLGRVSLECHLVFGFGLVGLSRRTARCEAVMCHKLHILLSGHVVELIGGAHHLSIVLASPVDQSPVAHIIGPHSYLRAHSIGACSAQSGIEVTRRRVVAECHPAHLLLLIIGCQRLVGVDVAICEGRLGTHHSAFVVGPVDKAPCCRRG